MLKKLFHKIFPPKQYSPSGRKIILPLTTQVFLGQDQDVWGYIDLYRGAKGRIDGTLKLPKHHKVKQAVEDAGKTLTLQFEGLFYFDGDRFDEDTIKRLSHYGEFKPEYLYKKIIEGCNRLKHYSTQPYFC